MGAMSANLSELLNLKTTILGDLIDISKIEQAIDGLKIRHFLILSIKRLNPSLTVMRKNTIN
jgi:hypothetical protein